MSNAANFDGAAYLAANPDVAGGWAKDPYSHYTTYGIGENRPIAPAATTPVAPAATATPGASALPVQVVAGTANAANQMNVADYAGQLIGDPSAFFMQDNPATPGINESMSMSQQNSALTPGAASQIDGTKPIYQPGKTIQAGTATAGTAATATAPTAQNAATYTAALSAEQVAAAAMTAAQGTVSAGAIIDASETPQIDMQGTGTGINTDGSINQTGVALKDYASQNIGNLIDTSTVAGKLLAQTLGEGNYTDTKATLKGQLDILSKEFVNAQGEPTIPSWAAGTARNVSKIAAFSGMTGTAATAAMSQAIMEASIPVAQQDAQFFQTVTLKNLDNKQASTINRANVLAKMDLANMDTRLAVAVQNSKNFMDMDLANLNNEQQARVINTQARVQAILEDSKAVNAQRMFTADSQNDMTKFYDTMEATISQFNASQTNNMTQFNLDQMNSQARFNADLEVNQQQFEKTMAYNIDVSNAKWRQDITLQTNQNTFDAAATDVKNMVGVSVEELNRLWNRSDSLLDYVWKSSESEQERANNIAIAKMSSDSAAQLQGMKNDAADAEGTGAMIGSIVTAGATSLFNSKGAQSFFSSLF